MKILKKNYIKKDFTYVLILLILINYTIITEPFIILPFHLKGKLDNPTILNFGINHYPTFDKYFKNKQKPYTIHAEHDLINNLPFSKKKKKTKRNRLKRSRKTKRRQLL